MDKLIIFICLSLLSACGVKGDPLPPLKPTELGRGRPTYKRATETIQINEKAGDAMKPAPAIKMEEGDDED